MLFFTHMYLQVSPKLLPFTVLLVYHKGVWLKRSILSEPEPGIYFVNQLVHQSDRACCCIYAPHWMNGFDPLTYNPIFLYIVQCVLLLRCLNAVRWCSQLPFCIRFIVVVYQSKTNKLSTSLLSPLQIDSLTPSTQLSGNAVTSRPSSSVCD